jgi:immune inhibitor A
MLRLRLLAVFLALAAATPGHLLTDAGARPSGVPGAQDLAPAFMPLNPDVVQSYQATGRAVPLARAEARFAGRPNVTINRIQRPSSATAGTVKAIVLLVKFTDDPPGGPTTRFRPTVWDSMLFRDTYIRGGADTTTIRTLKRFYSAVSFGTVDIVTLNLPGSVGWLSAPNNYAYYCQHDGTHDNGFGPYPRNVQRLVMDAVTAANPYVDFSQYAVGGVVRNLFVVHAGSGAEWSGGADLIWSHAWSIIEDDGFGTTPPPLYVDGVQIAAYSMEPEAGGDTAGEAGPAMTPQLPTVGVYAHEFGHVLGLPDEYDYGYESAGTGRISLMAGGSWNRMPNIYPDCAGNSPAQPSAWGMAYLGFVTPTVVTTLTPGITIPPIETSSAGAIYKVVQPGSSGKEYWLFENRQQLGFDQGFSRMGPNAHGLCIYHVDENVLARSFWLPNEAECVSGGVYRGQKNCDCDTLAANRSNGEKWYGIAVEQADGLYQLELGYGSDWRDFYSSATGVTSFTPGTVPNTSSYYTNNACAGLAAATNIQEIGQNITLDLTADVRTYTLGVTVAGSGSVGRTPNLGAYQHGSTVTLQATPAAGWYFAGWSGDTTGGVNPVTLTMYANKSLTATFAPTTGVESGPVAALALQPVRPSPMRGTGQIGFSLPREARVRLEILDLQGRAVAVLADGVLPAGRHAATWDGRAARGTAPAGLYFVRLSAEGQVLSQRLVRLR